MFSPEVSAHKGICYASTWRGLHDGPGHPSYYVMLSPVEIAQLAATGSFTLPLDEIPESVKAWRKLQDDLARDAAENAVPVLTAKTLRGAAGV